MALAWLALGVVHEVQLAVNRQVVDPPRGVGPANWRYGSPQADGLRGFLARAAAWVPPGEPVAFASQPKPASAEFFRFLWASYFLADRQVIPSSHPAGGAEAEYWISYAVRLAEPQLELLYEEPAGAVYRRVRRTSTSGGAPPGGGG